MDPPGLAALQNNDKSIDVTTDGVVGAEYLEDLPGDVGIVALLLAAQARGVDHQDRPGRVSPPVTGPAQCQCYIWVKTRAVFC